MNEFWSAFLPQLLAGLVGAGVGVFGVVLGFRLQARSAAAADEDRAVENLLIRMAEFVDAMTAYQEARQFGFLPRSGRVGSSPDPLPKKPYPYAVSIAFDILKLRVQADGREALGMLSRAWAEVQHSRHVAGQVTGAGILAGAVVEWRTEAPLDQVRKTAEAAIRHARGFEDESDAEGG